MITGYKDVDREIFSKLNDRELLTACSINKYTWNTVCDDNFLKRRLHQKYLGIEKYKKEKETWKHFYLRVVHYIEKMKEEFNYEYTYGDFEKQYHILEKSDKKSDKSYEMMRNLFVQAVEEDEIALVEFCLKYKRYYKFYPFNNILDKTVSYEMFKYLVENGAKINNNALKWASYKGQMGIVKYLVENGVNIHLDNDIALRDASRYGHLGVVKYLVEHGANIHAQDDDALMWATWNGYLEVVKYLVEHGASNINEALLKAIINDNLEIVKYLIEHGANVHYKKGIKYAKRKDVIDYLISKGAKINIFRKIKNKFN